MVLIFSNNADRSTDSIIDWLLFYEVKFLRVNYEDLSNFLRKISFENGKREIVFNYSGIDVSLSEVTAVWFRRTTFNNWSVPSEIDVEIDGVHFSDRNYSEVIRKHLQSEFKIVVEYVYMVMQDTCRVLGHYRENRENKLSVLRLAQDVGLLIPRSLVFRPKSNSNYFNEFVNVESITESQFISKALSYSPSIRRKNSYPMSSYTEDFNYNEIPPDKEYQLSLVQEKIDKLFELRVFYLNRKFYCVAIFSQSSNITKTDYRKYDYDNPNRTVPYKLPEDIKAKVESLMDGLSLNTGSIDMIVNHQYEYVFLEVNPVGQFGNVSYYGGYKLEKKIANYLIGK